MAPGCSDGCIAAVACSAAATVLGLGPVLALVLVPLVLDGALTPATAGGSSSADGSSPDSPLRAVPAGRRAAAVVASGGTLHAGAPAGSPTASATPLPCARVVGAACAPPRGAPAPRAPRPWAPLGIGAAAGPPPPASSILPFPPVSGMPLAPSGAPAAIPLGAGRLAPRTLPGGDTRRSAAAGRAEEVEAGPEPPAALEPAVCCAVDCTDVASAPEGKGAAAGGAADPTLPLPSSPMAPCWLDRSITEPAACGAAAVGSAGAGGAAAEGLKGEGCAGGRR